MKKILSNWEKAILEDVESSCISNGLDLSYENKLEIVEKLLFDKYIWQDFDERLDELVRKEIK